MVLGSLWKAVNRVTNGVKEKRCRCCEKWFPATVDYFHRRKERLHSECRSCANKLARAYHAERYVAVKGTRVVSEKPKQSYDASALEAAMRGGRIAVGPDDDVTPYLDAAMVVIEKHATKETA